MVKRKATAPGQSVKSLLTFRQSGKKGGVSVESRDTEFAFKEIKQSQSGLGT